MITIRVKEKDSLTACSIDDLEAELDEENQQVNIYYKNEFIGHLIEVYGIEEDEFINKIKHREN